MDKTINHLTPKQLADRWKLSLQTLNNWRADGSGPKFIKLGHRVLYPVIEVETFERKNLRTKLA